MLGVIIPVYNRADDFRVALKSLSNQTKKRFITIVIDDNSTEDIKSICNEFPDLMITYRKSLENYGSGASRQYGLNIAYQMNLDSVIFLDSDDMLAPNAIERLTYELNHTKADLIVSDIVSENQYKPDNIIESNEALTWTHGKIYRTNFLKKNNLCFPKTFRTNEDLAFNLCVYEAIEKEKKKYIPQQLYLWRDNKNSVTRKNSKESYDCNGLDYINAIHYYVTYCITNNLPIKRCINVIYCYKYYQIAKIRDKKIPYSYDLKIKDMLTNSLVKEKLKDRTIWYNLNLNSHSIEDKKFYFFQETLYEWLKNHNFDFDILGGINENIYC